MFNPVLRGLLEAAQDQAMKNIEGRIRYPDLEDALRWKYGLSLPEIEMSFDEVDVLISEYKEHNEL